MEERKDIEWYEWHYQVSNKGAIKSLPTHKIRKIFYQKWYPAIRLGVNKKRKNYRIHRLVASAFISNPHNLPEVNHKDWNKHNSYVENLEWCTRLENSRHSRRELGRIASKPFLWVKWKNHPMSKQVVQYRISWAIEKIRDSVADAQRYFGNETGSNIRTACTSFHRSAYWYRWRMLSSIQEDKEKFILDNIVLK